MSADRSVFIPNKWNLFLSLFFAAVFVFAIPWGDFTEFSDLKHYINRLEYLSLGGNERNFSGLQWVSSEIVWKAILLGIIDNVNSESYGSGPIGHFFHHLKWVFGFLLCTHKAMAADGVVFLPNVHVFGHGAITFRTFICAVIDGISETVIKICTVHVGRVDSHFVLGGHCSICLRTPVLP